MLAALLALAICVFVVVGCGSSGGDSSSSGSSDATSSTSDESSTSSTSGTSSLSTAAFVKKGDAVCAEGQKEIEAKFAAYLKKNKIKEIGGKGESQSEAEAHQTAVIETIAIPGLRKELEGLQALGTPSDDDGTAQEYVEAIEEGLDKGEEEPQALFSSTSKLFAKSDKLAKELGFKVCGNRNA